MSNQSQEETVCLNNRGRLLIFINIMVTGIATSMLSTAMTTALPAVMRDYGLDVTVGQWVTSGYSLVLAIVMPLTAFLIKRIPSRRLYLTGICIFILGEWICILAGCFEMLMAGRILQAVGNGVLLSMGQVLILTIFPPERRGAMMGYYGLASMGAPIIAPTIAGFLVDTIGWRYIFIFTVVIMILSLVMALFCFKNVLPLENIRFDVLSFVLTITVFGGITLGIGNISTFGWKSAAALLPLAAGIVTAVFFVRRQLSLETAFLDIRILRNRYFTVSVAGCMMLYFIMMGSSVLMPVYVQNVLGRSAVVSALVMLPGSIATAAVSPFAGVLLDKTGIRKLFISGSVLLLFSNAAMCFLTMQSPLWLASVFTVFRNLAIGLLIMPLLTWGSSHVPQNKVPDGTSLISSLRTVAGSVGSAVFAGVMAAVADMVRESRGDEADMFGFTAAFYLMTAGSLILLVFAVLGTGKEKKAD